MTTDERGLLGPALALLTEFVLEAHVLLAPRMRFGASKYGERFLVPITGGHFEGPLLHGEVLPGTDWQLKRPDGVTELDARYSLRAHDGTLIQVCNHGIVHMPKGARELSQIYVRTVPQFEAPNDSPHAWLNQAVFVGTLAEASAEFVKVRMYKVL
jgi:hypothetical protein